VIATQNIALKNCQLDYRELGLEIQEASSESEIKGAESAVKVTEGVMKDEKDQADAIAAVVNDLDGLCVIHEDGGDREMPTSSRMDVGASTDVENRLLRIERAKRDADRRATASLQLLENTKLDLEMCNTELNKCTGRVEWMIDSGAAEKE